MRLKIYLEIDVMKNRGFDFGDFEITKREILASISIIATMLLIGFGTMQEEKNKDVRKLHF